MAAESQARRDAREPLFRVSEVEAVFEMQQQRQKANQKRLLSRERGNEGIGVRVAVWVWVAGGTCEWAWVGGGDQDQIMGPANSKNCARAEKQALHEPIIVLPHVCKD